MARRRAAARPWAAALSVLAALVAVSGCWPAPMPAHPLGADCTWPATVDLQHDGLAVLHYEWARASAIVLYDVAAGTVRARCTGLSAETIGAEFVEPGYRDQQLSLFPMLSPDLRFGVTPTGVIEMATGQIVPNPDPRWPAVALTGRGTVLRQDTSRHERTTTPDQYCLAAGPDTPQAECRPLDGTSPGVPVVHDDGTVGWAPGTPVPIELTAPDGRTATGVMQTDGIGVAGVRLDPADNLDGTERFPPISRQTGLLPRGELRLAPALSDIREQPVWYTLDPATGTGALHVAPVTTDDVTLRIGPYADVVSGAVIDDGAAVLLVVAQLGSTEPSFHIVRVGEDGSISVVARLRRPHSEADLADPSSYDVRNPPTVLSWPDTVPVAAV